MFLWNLPKWNLPLGAYAGEKLTFRHWIAVDIKYTLPIPGRLYPSHYSLLYFIKGKKPGIFHPDRIPTPCCRHCGGELRDYGGYKDKMAAGHRRGAACHTDKINKRVHRRIRSVGTQICFECLHQEQDGLCVHEFILANE